MAYKSPEPTDELVTRESRPNGDGNNGEDEYEEDLELENNEDDNYNGDDDGGKNNDKAGGEGNDKHGGETKGKDGDKNESKVGGDRSGKDEGKINSKDGDESSSEAGSEKNNNDGGEGEDRVENYARNNRNEASSSGAKEGASEEVKKQFHNPSTDISLCSSIESDP
nr:uncharacterized protein DDB_G0290685-like [Drosophila bipectinata]